VDFLLVLIELFSLSVTAEALRAKVWTDLSSVLSQMRSTDGRTDRRTDGQLYHRQAARKKCLKHSRQLRCSM